ncbi:MAG: T9SS type A sorting domain-containing protein [Bacteroidetes bacterium]|nr:T9SS type A sorting domain-containing protein [Bacteroidota bacterium]
MKTTKDSILIVFLSGVILLFVFFINAVSNPNGMSGRTRKTTSSGCGSCHNFGTGITGTIEGPDSVQTGQTAVFTITLSFSGNANGGVDISAKRGALSAGASSSFLKLLNGELTHKNPIVFESSVSLDFNYTAPSTTGTDTLFATIDRNYPGAWNFIDNRGIKIFSSIGITENEAPVSFYMLQNYPNPFNALTRIKFGVKKPGFVKISVIDLKGNTIAAPVNDRYNPGDYNVKFDAANLASGIYFYKMEFSDGGGTISSVTGKMSLLK